eukprot:27854_1
MKCVQRFGVNKEALVQNVIYHRIMIKLNEVDIEKLFKNVIKYHTFAIKVSYGKYKLFINITPANEQSYDLDIINDNNQAYDFDKEFKHKQSNTSSITRII